MRAAGSETYSSVALVSQARRNVLVGVGRLRVGLSPVMAAGGAPRVDRVAETFVFRSRVSQKCEIRRKPF